MASTITTGTKGFKNSSIKNHALFLGGLDVTHDALAAYDPFKGGFGRIFMIRKPTFLLDAAHGIKDKFDIFKHILEYANTGISGISDIDVTSETITGGYVGREFAVPTIAKNNTNQFTISTYEFSGSPMREVLHFWISGVMDLQSGFSTYHGVESLDVKQSNHTAEFIYVLTDQTGKNIEYCCMFANCFPTNIKMDHLNTRSGEHNIAEMDIPFTCTMYESPKINELGERLLNKYTILMDSLEFNPKFSETVTVGTTEIPNLDPDTGYNKATGMIQKKPFPQV